MRFVRSFLRRLTLGVALAGAATGAAAELPGSLQPGATPVPPGELLILRLVPPRNALNPGVGGTVTAPTTPPSGVFAGVAGITRILSDNEAASITSQLPSSGSGQFARSAIDETLRQQPGLGGSATERATGSGAGGVISGAIQTGLGALKTGLGALPGGGG